MDDGDHKMSDESVDVESNIGWDAVPANSGLQTTDVTPASWPIKRASKVIVYCIDLLL